MDTIHWIGPSLIFSVNGTRIKLNAIFSLKCCLDIRWGSFSCEIECLHLLIHECHRFYERAALWFLSILSGGGRAMKTPIMSGGKGGKASKVGTVFDLRKQYLL